MENKKAKIKKITKLKLFYWYIIRNESQREVAEKFSVSRGTIRNQLDKYKIKKSKYLIKKSMTNSFFKKEHKLNLGRERLDMMGNKFRKVKISEGKK